MFWEEGQQKVLEYLVDILHQIEWHYGDNRAPFKYPPLFHTGIDPLENRYYECIIETDLEEPVEKFVFRAGSPEGLVEKVKFEVPKQFHLDFGQE